MPQPFLFDDPFTLRAPGLFHFDMDSPAWPAGVRP